MTASTQTRTSVNIHTISPGVPFLATLVEAILDGRVIEGFRPRDAPLQLSDLTLYLPTRRAVRAATTAFLSAFDGRPVLLPAILPLGAVDEDLMLFEADAGRPDASDLPPAISDVDRWLALAKEVHRWSGEALRNAAGLTDRPMIVPSSPADSLRLAQRLASLIDQVSTEEADWNGLSAAIRGDLSAYWDITGEFLAIATARWPEELEKIGLSDLRHRRDAILRAEADRLTREGAALPVIVAGSNNAAPANAAFLAAVARQRQGAVILPGLDLTMDDVAWDAVGEGDGPAGAGHPQHSLKCLLDRMACARRDVRPLGRAPKPLELRERLVVRALCPARMMDRWSGSDAMEPEDKASALSDVAVIEAHNEREEALAVAVCLRQCVEDGRDAALITPDRDLARRVAAELERWRIRVDDSAGQQLGLTPPGIFARLIAQCALDGMPPVGLLALLKHPLACFGMSAPDARRAARLLERCALRGLMPAPGLEALNRAFRANRTRFERAEAKDPGARKDEAWRALDAADWDFVADFIDRVREALGPLDALRHEGRPRTLRDYLEAHGRCIGEASRDAQGRSSLCGERDAAQVLAAHLQNLREAHHADFTLAPPEYPAFFNSLMSGATVRRRGGDDRRVQILGSLEARLQSFSCVVLGALNEHTWPAVAELDPFLSRPMREAIGLGPPEQRTGLAAHDVAQALGQPKVVLSRSIKTAGAPSIPSRWLQRIEAYAGPELRADMLARGGYFLALARALDAPERPQPCDRPAPCPPVEVRPCRLSVTEIETLIRDPYAIYARHVLRLRPFEELGRQPTPAERGTLIHTILERFIRERPRGPFDGAAHDRLLELGRAAFADLAERPLVKGLWWRRFERAADWFIAWERNSGDARMRHCELSGRLEFPDLGFTLTGRADRIDRLADGSLAIIDYKTGSPPSAKQVATFSPQLPLEAVMAGRGAFEGLAPGAVSSLVYCRLSGGREPGKEQSAVAGGHTGDGSGVESLADKAEANLRELVQRFQEPTRAYLSKARPDEAQRFEGDYDHLARVQEWSLVEEGDAA